MIEIDRLELRVRVTAIPDRAEALTCRVRDAAAASAARQRIALAGAPPGAYIFIEHLEFACAINGAWDRDAIGEAVTRGLAAAIEEAPRVPGVTIFNDRCEFVAAFLLALVGRAAWNRWWFEDFDGLKPLSVSSAIRTVIINEGNTGVAALVRLTREGAVQVVRALSAGDAQRLVAWIERRGGTVSADASALWSLSRSLQSCDETDGAQWLAVLIACERSTTCSAGPATLAMLRAMVKLRQLAASGRFTTGDFMTDVPVTALRDCANRWGVDPSWLDRVTDTVIAAIAEDLGKLASAASGQPANAGEGPTASSGPQHASTRHGGAFLLLGLLCRLGWPDHWQRRLDESVRGKAADKLTRALALAVAAKALAPDDACAVASDPALLLATDLSNAASLLRKHGRLVCAALRETACGAKRPGKRGRRGKRLVGGMAETPIGTVAALVLRKLSERVLGLAESTDDYLRANVLALPASVERTDAHVAVGLGRAPLDVLLVLSGVKRCLIALPGAPNIELRENSHA